MLIEDDEKEKILGEDDKAGDGGKETILLVVIEIGILEEEEI